MLIPINTEKDSSLALSIVKSAEGYSVVPCSIVNGYGMAHLPSYMAGMEKFTTEMGTIVDPIVVFDHYDKEVKGDNLEKCLDKVMRLLGSFNDGIIPINVPNDNSLAILIGVDDKMYLFSAVDIVAFITGEALPNYRALTHCEDYDFEYLSTGIMSVITDDFYEGLEEIITLIKEKFMIITESNIKL